MKNLKLFEEIEENEFPHVGGNNLSPREEKS